MTDKKDIAYQTAKILLDTQSVLINTKEPFTYTSGKIGPVYVDIRRMMSFPKERSILMDFAAQMLKPLDFDYIAGGETAGIPYAAFISERLGLPMLYVRKKPKGHGRMAQIEGHIDGEGKNILLVEDLQNRGTSQTVFIDAIRTAGSVIKHVFVLFAYNIYDHDKDRDTELHYLTDWWSILDVVKSEKTFDDDAIASLESFLNDPESWAEKYEEQAQAS